MNERIEYWKLNLERLRLAHPVDWSEVSRIAGEIAHSSTHANLRQAAEQALSVIRLAALDGADRVTNEAARQRLEGMLEIIHGMAAPSFGRRSAAVPERLTREERARKTLGLPPVAQLTVDDIHRAYRRLAKTMHPDQGGSEQAFLDLTAARDALIHPGAYRDA